MELLNDAFHQPERVASIQKGVSGAKVEAWVNEYDKVISEQVRRRAILPQHHATGAIDRTWRECANLGASCILLSQRRAHEPIIGTGASEAQSL